MLIQRSFNIIEYFFKYLIILIPLALIIGPAPTDIILSLLALFIVLRSLYFKEYFYFNNIYFKVIFIFALYLIIISALSDNVKLSLESSIFYIRFILFSISLAYFFDKYEIVFNYFFIALIICVVFVSLDGFFQYFNGFNVFGFVSIHDGRISGVFKEELILGSYVSRLVPLCFFYISLKHSKSKTILLSAIFSIILFDILIYLSGERSAFVYLLLSTIIIIFLTQKLRSFRLYTFVCSILIIIIISFINPESKNRMIDNTLKQINFGQQGEKLRIFSEEHQDHYTTAIKMFKDSPIIGHGPKLFRELCDYEKYQTLWGCSTHPHNTYVQLMSETGLIGTIPVVTFFLFIIFKLFKQFVNLNFYKNKINLLSDEKIYIYLSLLISLWPLVPTGNFFGNWINAIYFIPFAILIRKKNE